MNDEDFKKLIFQGLHQEKQEDSTMVSIAGIPKVDLLLNLYNNALCQGTAFDNTPQMKVMGKMMAGMAGNKEKAVAILATGKKYFDYEDLGAGPRPLKFRLYESEIEASQYDEYNGKGLASKVVKGMREEIEQTSRSKRTMPKPSF